MVEPESTTNLGVEMNADRYRELIVQAYEKTQQPEFDVVGFLKDEKERLDEALNPNERVEVFVEVSETLGNAINTFDEEQSLEKYDEFCKTLRALDPELKHLCRAALKSGDATAARLLPMDEVISASLTGAQLMQLLT